MIVTGRENNSKKKKKKKKTIGAALGFIFCYFTFSNPPKKDNQDPLLPRHA
jgi:hypothetical protein